MSFIINPSTGGGSTAPGGADTNVQYNNAGAFGGASDVLYSSSFHGLFSNKIKTEKAVQLRKTRESIWQLGAEQRS
jgi:hypothetical protein